MPKVKKNKIVSLVAYESGAESDNENINESDDESEATNEESETERESEDESLSKQKKSDSEDAHEGTNQDILNNIISKENQPNEFVTEKSEIESQVNLTEAIKFPNPDSKYTVENGFPPGCSNIQIPPLPSAPCSQALQNKILQVIDRMDKYNYSINDDIYRRKQFKNPSIYEKLIEVYGIDEYGSNFPDHIEDLKSNGYLLYDELNEIQMQSWAKIEKEKQAKTKVEMISGVKKK